MSQQASPELWGRLVEAAIRLPYIEEGHSAVSPASSRALLFTDMHATLVPWASLAPVDRRLEPVHIHGVLDTSVHACLPADRVRAVVTAGWGVPHAYADFNTEVLLFGPRDEAELELLLGLIRESLAWSRVSNLPGAAVG